MGSTALDVILTLDNLMKGASEWLRCCLCYQMVEMVDHFAYESRGGLRILGFAFEYYWDLVGGACFCPVLTSVGNWIVEC